MAVISSLISFAAKKIGNKSLSAAQKRSLAKAVKASAMARRKSATGFIAKRRVAKLSKISSKIKANNAALKKISKGTKTVYRVQNAKGEGPLMGKNLKHYAAMPTSVKKGYKVAPVSDYNRRRAAILKALAPKGTPFEEIKFNKGDKFAFKSVSQANKYFSKEEQAFLKTRGFTLQKINNVKIIGSSPTQVSYRVSTDITKIIKENEKLAKEYAKLAKKV